MSFLVSVYWLAVIRALLRLRKHREMIGLILVINSGRSIRLVLICLWGLVSFVKLSFTLRCIWASIFIVCRLVSLYFFRSLAVLLSLTPSIIALLAFPSDILIFTLSSLHVF
jgi:hypothetical protein